VLIDSDTIGVSPIPNVLLFGGVAFTQGNAGPPALLPFNASYITLCPAGTTANDGICIPCLAGYFKNFLLAPCLPCPSGTYSSIVAAAQCAGFCEPGYYSESQAQTSPSTCVACPLGSFMYPELIGANLISTCMLCPYGTFSNVSTLLMLRDDNYLASSSNELYSLYNRANPRWSM
jgi:hypothetical protein